MNNDAVPLPIRAAYQNLAAILNSGSEAALVNQLSQAWLRIEQNPMDVGAVNVLGMLAEKIRQYSLAEVFFQHALRLDPHIAILHGNLANVLKAQGKLDAALVAYKAAVKINPGLEDYYLAAAAIYISGGDNDQLLAWLESALTHCPESVGLLVHMGEAVKRSGDSEQAIVYFRKALALAPAHSYIYQTLAHTKKFSQPDEDIVAMKALLEDAALPDEGRVRLNFALAKAYEDMAEYGQSFSYYSAGNQLVRDGSDYNQEDDGRLFSLIEKIFDQNIFQKYEGAGCDSEVPIFILSMPRSGSTLLEHMLAAHQQVYGAGELALLPKIVRTLWVSHVSPANSSYPAGADTLPADMLRAAGEFYVNNVKSLAGHKTVIHITDKLPLNFLYVGIIKLILPKAFIIHCHRDPVDTCFSCFKQLFSSGHHYAYNLEDLGRFYGRYQKLMSHWHKVLPGQILDVEYESLVDDQAGQLKRILEHCGLPWDDACMTYFKSENAAMTASSVQVKQPLYKSATGYWHRYEQYLDPLLAALGK